MTLARLQVNRDLRAASEERGEDERRRTRTRGEDEGELVAIASRATVALDARGL